MNERLRYSAENCSVAAALAVVGEKWTLLVLREAFFGLRRFEEFQQVVGCARNILSDRLTKLVANELMSRTAYREHGQRERYEYQLTERGVELFPVLVSLMQWGDRWLSGNSGVPVVVRHQHCGSIVRVELRCEDGHGPLSPRDTMATPGSGAILANVAF
ncbi:winged helix-turn-helix transcriptional regulator [Polaromonas sp.]|uniref:winged helix-turn-helix transcriptional regulator n=1 Tax=Polaromonas sp. TaxID=1869339 RepID=UPI00352A70B3